MRKYELVDTVYTINPTQHTHHIACENELTPFSAYVDQAHAVTSKQGKRRLFGMPLHSGKKPRQDHRYDVPFLDTNAGVRYEQVECSVVHPRVHRAQLSHDVSPHPRHPAAGRLWRIPAIDEAWPVELAQLDPERFGPSQEVIDALLLRRQEPLKEVAVKLQTGSFHRLLLAKRDCSSYCRRF
jgi:hypothetical protein